MKRKEKAVRRFMALLAAVCMLGSMPDLSVVSHAAENGKESLETYDAGADGMEEISEDSDVKEQADGMEQEEGETAKGAEKQEDTEEKEAGEPENTKDMEESEEKEDTGEDGTEESNDKEGTGESGAEETDKDDTSEEGDSDGEEKSEETPEGETDLDDEEAETGEETAEEEEDAEAEETGEEDDKETEEAEEEDVILLAAQAEGSVQVDSTYTDGNGVIYHYYGYDDGTAEIYELEDCMESSFRYKALDIPAHVGDYTVTRLTFTFSATTQAIPSVTIPETVTYMRESLFKFMTILELHYNAEAAETGAASEYDGIFFRGDIRKFELGGNVRSIPDYCFSWATITLDELNLNVERIGRQAFYHNKTITTLTIGENVKEIGYQAFTWNDIENIIYNAVDATQSPQYGYVATGPFGYTSVSSITIGDKVTVIPENLFCNISYTADTLVFPDCLTTVGAWAFYGSSINIGELTIGENITSIGSEAFARGKIGILNYNAVDAKLDGVTEANNHRTSFWGSDVGELRIGEHVESLPDTLFYAIALTQDTLVLPDSITYIGSYVLSHSDDNNSGQKVQIGTLEIGENITHIGKAAFGRNTYDRVVVRTVEADVPPRTNISLELPVCKEIEIHGKSPYYDFFTNNTDKDNIVLLCEDFETTYGEEYYDAGKKSFVTLITEACVVCGYGETREEYSEACTVIFTDYNGRELSRQNIHKGDDATAPEEPERTGYLFTGWDKDITNVTSDLTVRAEYEIQKFSVVFKDGDRIISEQEVSYTDSAKVPENPTRPEEEWGSWRFTGWSGNYTNVTKDEVVTAQFEKILNQYEVLFYDAEGNVISRQTVAHGEAAEEPEAPKKEATAQYNYTFTGWSADTEGITGDTAFYPVYEEETRFYTVTFMNGSTVLDTQTVEYGDDATAPEAPTRPEEEWGSWKFTGWSGSYTNITKDEVIRAAFEKVLNEYEVTFCDAEGNVVSRQTVEYGNDATAPEAPTRPEEEWGSWKFTGWSGNYTNVTKDEVVTAQFEKILNQYEVLFYDAEGNVISRQTVAHGEDAEEPEAPKKESTAQYNYTFTGWSADTEGITGDTAFYPVYEAETRSYTVTFMNGSTVLDTQTVEYGDDAAVPEAPTRPEEEWGSWKFTGWSGSYTNITKDEVIRAAFEKILNEYEVIFYDADDNILSRQTVKHGMSAEAPKAPEIEPTERECYVFAGWDGDIDNITGESVFHPVYETKARTYTVTFMNGDISYNVQKVEYGSAAVTPPDPSKEEDADYTYRFIGWDQDYSFITGDLTVRAVFEQVEKPKEEEKDKGKPKDKDPDGKKPGGGDGDEGDNGQEPDDGTDGDGGQPDGESVEDAGGKPVVSVPEVPAKKKIPPLVTLPQTVCEESPASIPEISEESVQPEETEAEVQEEEPGEQEMPQETEDTGKEWQMPGWLWLLLLSGIGGGVFSIWLLLFCHGKRTVRGTVLDGDGNAVCGVKVSLTGTEDEMMEVQTDEDGQYIFEGLDKGDYRLCLFDEEETVTLLMDIRMGVRDREKVFSILKSDADNVETDRSGKKYRIDVAV